MTRKPDPWSTPAAAPAKPVEPPSHAAIAAFAAPNHFVEVVDGSLSLRSPPGASDEDRVRVAMLKLRTDIMMGPDDGPGRNRPGHGVPGNVPGKAGAASEEALTRAREKLEGR